MSNWLKIRNSLYASKIREIDSLFDKLEESIKNNYTRKSAFKPLDEWAASQILLNADIKLSIQEYSILNRIVNNLKENIVLSDVNNNFLKESRENFKVNYLRLIHKKEEELKLEFAATAIVESKFPIGLIESLYFDLSKEQFNEAMGEFWGGMWEPTMKKAAELGSYGAAAGLFTPTGPVAGGLAGAAIGGLYGAGKHLLNKVWQAHKNQQNFVNTKEDALNILKKLQLHSHKAGIADTKYHQTLNDLIDHLSGKQKSIYPTPEELTTINKATEEPSFSQTQSKWSDWGTQTPQTVATGPATPATAAEKQKVPEAPISKEEKPQEQPLSQYFSSWSDIVHKIGSQNVDALLDGKMNAIADNKVKNLIMLIGEAIKNIVGSTAVEPEKLRLISLEQLNKAMAEVKDSHEDMENPFGVFSDLTKGKFANLAQAYISNVINKLARQAGELRRLGIKKRVQKKVGAPEIATPPGETVASSAPAETPTAPVSGAMPAPEPPSTPETKKEKSPVMDVDDLSEFERDIYLRLGSKELITLLFDTFYSGLSNKLSMVKDTPLEKMLEDEKVGAPGSKKRMLVISSLRKIFNKDKISDASDLVESIVEKFKRLLREDRPSIVSFRAKGLSLDDKVKFYKEQLRSRLN